MKNELTRLQAMIDGFPVDDRWESDTYSSGNTHGQEKTSSTVEVAELYVFVSRRKRHWRHQNAEAEPSGNLLSSILMCEDYYSDENVSRHISISGERLEAEIEGLD